MLEKLVVELTNVLGADVVIEPAEEIKEDNGTIVFSTVVLTNHSLDVDELMAEISQIVTLCNKFDVVYDGWGTYPDGSDEE
jgi:regulator of RNase E activity RraB